MIISPSPFGAIDLASLLLIAIGLSADCFAVTVGISVSGKACSLLHGFLLSISFGLFQTLMPILGYLAGRALIDLISSYDHWVAFGLLALVGGRMIWESFHEKENENKLDITKGIILLTLSLATSVDSLAAGLTFAFLNVNIWLSSLVIGLVAFSVTMVGFFTGKRLGKLIGERAETIGGIVLIGIGLRILFSHLS